jgi:hypothetical protein
MSTTKRVNHTARALLVLGTALAAALALATCDLWGARDNPVDSEGTNYEGVPTVTTTGEIRTVFPSDGGTLTGFTVSVTKVLDVKAYGIRIAAASADLDAAPLFSKDDSASNQMDLNAATDVLANSKIYYWKAHAKGADGSWGGWSPVAKFTSSWTTVGTPFFGPSEGTYSSDQQVTISCGTSGATVRYTSDGSAPTTSSTVYSGPIAVAGNGTTKTIKAMATKAGMLASSLASATYTIAYNKISTPQFDPTAGTYSSDQAVSVSCGTSGATIYYTTNGSAPTTASTVYSVPIAVTGNGTVMSIKAIAAKTGMLNSDVASAAYTIAYDKVSTPQLSPPSGTYTTDQSVTITCGTSGATIYYTTNGTAPSTASTVYGGPIAVAGNGTAVTITAIAAKSGMATSTAASASYSIAYPVAKPTFTPGAGTYTADQSVTISCATSGATIYYTTDGNDPTTSSSVYSVAIPIPVAGNGTMKTIKALAAKSGLLNSAVASATYTITYPTVATPTFNPIAGSYTSDQSVSISCATVGATIYYTTDGNDPTTSSSVYGVAIPVAGNGTTKTIKAIAAKAGYSLSNVGSTVYTITYPVAATPTFDPVGGTYTGAQTVKISTTTSGAQIRYTTDGTDPSSSAGTLYSGLVNVATSMTFKAIAYKSGCVDSSIASAAYVIHLAWTDRTSAGTRKWWSIASSSDGSHLAAVVLDGDIWTSVNGGDSWTDQTVALGAKRWWRIASSSDGSHLAACIQNGDIWTSTDYGATWNDQVAAGARYWRDIASSSDGSHLAACVESGDIWTSPDYGATWNDRIAAGSKTWWSISSSSDGSRLIAGINGGYINISSDWGATWTEITSAGSRGWLCVTSSGDGNHLAVGDWNGNIWTTTDGGNTWLPRTGAGSVYWWGIASSSDGSHIAATATGNNTYGGDIWTSSDGGNTWTDQSNAGKRLWTSVTMSSDGSLTAACYQSGDILTGQ